MKKLISLFLSAGILAIVACGPSAKEKEAEQARINDSIAADSAKRAQEAVDAAMKMTQDSLARVSQDSAMKAMQDSIAMINKKIAPKPVKPKTNEQKMKEDKKVLEHQKG